VEIQPATLAQVRAGRDGRRIVVEDDVLNIASRLKQIDPCLSLHWNEKGEHFVVVETSEDGDERLVLTALQLDERVLERVGRIASPSYDYAREVDRLDAQAEREKDHRFHEQTGEVAERLAHALRQDLQAKNKIILPRGV
jgi:tRNA threonylcarbamoyladenosine modification (KEOPS) complex Cgi121 subunit